jgi:hypothetical protein
LEQPEPYSTLKTLICRKYAFQKLTQLSQGKNVLDDPASKADGFLYRETYISSTQLNRPIWNKMSLSSPENYDLQEVFLSKTNPTLKGKQCATCCSLFLAWNSLMRYVFLQLS